MVGVLVVAAIGRQFSSMGVVFIVAVAVGAVGGLAGFVVGRWIDRRAVKI
jgi:hypothetical protein